MGSKLTYLTDQEPPFHVRLLNLVGQYMKYPAVRRVTGRSEGHVNSSVSQQFHPGPKETSSFVSLDRGDSSYFINFYHS